MLLCWELSILATSLPHTEILFSSEENRAVPQTLLLSQGEGQELPFLCTAPKCLLVSAQPPSASTMMGSWLFPLNLYLIPFLLPV